MAERRYSLNEIEEMPREVRRNFVNCLSGYKPVCLCGTLNPGGQTNLSVISSVIHVGAHPPLVGMLMRPHVVERHTIENIDRTGCYTLNHISEDFYYQAHQASASYPRERSEFAETGLTEFFGDKIPPPYVKEAPLKIGLIFKERHKILTNATIFLVGEVQEVFLPEEAVGQDGFISFEKVGSLAVTGLDRYHKGLALDRLSYAKPDQELKEKPETS